MLRMSRRDAARALARNYARGLMARPAAVAVLRRECVERDPLTIALETLREDRSLELARRVTEAGLMGGTEQQLLFALFGAATNYLLIRGELRTFSGLPVGTEEAWDAIADGMASIAVALTVIDD